MLSVKSCFNSTLFRKNLARFWPIWTLYGVILAISLPVMILGNADIVPEYKYRLSNYPMDYLPFAVLLAAGFAILAAMAVFSYLYSSRSVGMLHALPVRRETLFFTNYLSGLCFFWLPNLAVFLLTLGIEAWYGVLRIGILLLWLAAVCLADLFFFSFAAFCAMFTGHILALPAFYVILNGLVYGLSGLFNYLESELLFGYAGPSSGTETAVRWLTPLYYLYRVSWRQTYDEEGLVHFYNMGYFLVYALIGLLLAGLALAVYRRRHLETAGDIVTVNWVRPVFKYGVAACASITLGLFFYEEIFVFLPRETWVLLFFLLLGGVIGYFAADMLLQKTFRVFRKGWKGCLALMACVVLVICALEFDVTGFEKQVPSSARVESALVSIDHSAPYDSMHYESITLSSPEDLERLEKLHQTVVDGKEWIEDTEETGHSEEIDGVYVQTSGITYLYISYMLKDGNVMQRSYSVPISAGALAEPESAAAQMNAILNTPELIERGYFAYLEEGSRLVDATIDRLWDREAEEYDEQAGYVPAEALPELLEAVHSDLSAGRLGRRYLLNDMERQENCYLSNLTLTFMGQEATDQGWGSIVDYGGSIVRIGLEASATDTLAVLEKYGIINEKIQLVTHAEADRSETSMKYGY